MLINDTDPFSQKASEENKVWDISRLFCGSVSKRTSIFFFEARTDTKAHVKVYTECFFQLNTVFI